MSNNIEVLSAVHGIAPRSDDLLRLGGDVERGRVSSESYESLLAQETIDWLDLQVRAGIDLKEDGKLGWQDHLRPIVKATEGFSDDIDEAPVTRWFDTNTFYRKPTIIGPLKLNAEAFRSQIGTTSGESASLIAPLTFTSLCDSRAPEDAFINVLDLYSQLLTFYESSGAKRIVFEEYVTPHSLVEQICDKSGAVAVDELTRAFPGLLTSYLQIGEKAQLIPLNWPENLGLGVRLEALKDWQRTFPDGPFLDGKESWQQVIDANTTQEDTLQPSDYPRAFLARTERARVVLTHTVDLERLPLKYAQEKVKHLGEFAVNLRDYLEEAI